MIAEEGEGAAGHEEIPAREIQSRKGDIARADHQGQEKIAEDSRDGWNQKKPDHDHAMNGEELVVSLGGDEVALRGEQLQPHQCRRRAADEEEKRNRDHVEDRDPLVIRRE